MTTVSDMNMKGMAMWLKNWGLNATYQDFEGDEKHDMNMIWWFQMSDQQFEKVMLMISTQTYLLENRKQKHPNQADMENALFASSDSELTF